MRRRFVLGLLAVAMATAVMVGGWQGTAHAETRGCGYEQYAAWFYSRPEQDPHLHDGVMHYYDDEDFAEWWAARYCGVD